MFRTFLVGCLLVPTLLTGQSTIRVMDYNLLNFPEPVPPGRVDTLRKILAYHPVDLLIVQELRSAAGATSVLQNALNAGGEDRFSMAPYVPPISAPWLTETLAQAVYFDRHKLAFKRQTTLVTNVRDINVVDLYLRTPGLVAGDTMHLTVCAMHLKAGNTASDISSRVSMINVLMGHLAQLPADRHVIVAGDMNLYTGDGPEFNALLSTSGAMQLVDPLGLGGTDWSGGSHPSVYTQSTRTTSIYNDGAGGGIDDRFDIMLTSASLLDNEGDLYLQSGSYRAFGNSGTCYDQSITSCFNGSIPFSILRSLYYMSDHVPVVMELVCELPLGGMEPPSPPPAVTLLPLGHGRWSITATDLLDVRVYDTMGRSVPARWVLRSGNAELQLPMNGVHLVQVTTSRGSSTQKLHWSGE